MIDPTTSDKSICNLEAALVRLGGDQELLLEMIDFYLEDYLTLTHRLRAAAESGDPVSLARSAHSLKGLAANFDGIEVVEAANAVTQASRAGFGRAPWIEIARLSKAAEELADHLEAVCEECEVTNANDSSD